MLNIAVYACNRVVPGKYQSYEAFVIAKCNYLSDQAMLNLNQYSGEKRKYICLSENNCVFL